MDNAETFAEKTLAQVSAKMKAVVARNRGIIPYTTDAQQHFSDMYQKDPFWWTNGFWGGELWQLNRLTGEALFREEAIAVERKLDANLTAVDHLDHDNGFKWGLTAVAHFKDDQDPDARRRGLLAAENMAGRFNLAGHYFRAWNDEDGTNRADLAIIDCMMNLPLLVWASQVEQDPRFKHLALAHAKMAQQLMVRGDGSVKHILVFDPETGAYLHSQGGQGYAHGSSWTRGQAWGIYGFALAARHFHDPSFLVTAQRIANYFIANIPADCRIPVDFRQPQTPFYEDASAAAIAASGLLELAADQPKDAPLYQRTAVRLLQALADDGVDWDQDHDALVKRCSAQYHEPHHEYPIIYADYFFTEALMKLNHTALDLW